MLLPTVHALNTGIVFYDNAETGTASDIYNLSQGGSDGVFNYSTDQAFNGTRSLRINNTLDFQARYADLNVSLDQLTGYEYSAYFYDDGRSDGSLLGTGLGLQNQGTALLIGAYTPLSASTYFVSVNASNVVTGVTRTTGWHHAEIIINSSTSVVMLIDGTVVYNNSVDDLSSNEGVIAFEEGFGVGDVSYYDDILVFQVGNGTSPPPPDVAPSIISTSQTISGDNATLSLFANATDPDTPTVAFSWNLIKDGTSIDTGTTGNFPANLTANILNHAITQNGTYSFNVSVIGNATILGTNSISATFGPPIIVDQATKDSHALNVVIDTILIIFLLIFIFSVGYFDTFLRSEYPEFRKYFLYFLAFLALIIVVVVLNVL